LSEGKTIFVTGLTRIWAGVTSVADGLLKRNIRTIFYHMEIHQELYRLETIRDYEVVSAPRNRLSNLSSFYKCIRHTRPDHIELYHHLPDDWITIGQIFIAMFLRIPLVTVCTGGEILYWKDHSNLRKTAVRISLLFSKVVIVKELYMKESIIKHNISSTNKLEFVHNAIELGPEPTYRRQKRKILFLNTFKKYRNMELIIRAVPGVLKSFPDTEFLLVGLTGKKGEADHIQLVDDMKLGNSVKLLPFTKTPQQYYDDAAIFLLPADIVFCNNALLEAMKSGIPPIVADVAHADLVVEHNVSGLVVKKDSTLWEKAITSLLADENFRLRLAKGARQKVEKDFDEAARSNRLKAIYQKNIWR
jgi:glycosyltransferase involved in cell wall biosynthesis